MNPSTDFDRLLTSWLETAGPADPRSETVGMALTQARTSRQRLGLAGFLVGPAAWPRRRRDRTFGGLTPAFRIAIVAALLIALAGAAIWGSGGLPGLFVQPTQSPATSTVPVTAAPTLAVGAPAYEAIYLRQSTDAVGTFVDAFVVRPDGRERLVRRIRNTVPGIHFHPSTFGIVSRDGWLAVYAESDARDPEAPYGQYAVFDLRDPSRDPLLVPANGAVGGRWSIDGLFAVPHPSDFSMTRIVDPRTGSTTELGKVLLFGGGPSIVWTSDGSGILDGGNILDGGKIKPADGGPDIPIDPGTLFSNRLVGMGGHGVTVCLRSDPQAAPPCAGVTRTTVRVADLRGDNGVDWYSSDDPTEVVNAAGFAADGRGVWLTLDRVANGHHRAIIALADAPFHVTTIATIELPADAINPFVWDFAPDDAQMLFGYSTGPQDNPKAGPSVILHLDGTQHQAPSGFLAGYALGSQAESWPAEGDFVTPTH